MADSHPVPSDSAAPLLTIVLPTRNERETAPTLVRQLVAGFRETWECLPPALRTGGLDVLVIDASDDGTAAALDSEWEGHHHPDQSSDQTPMVRVICRQQSSSGFSGAVGEGLSEARGQWILCMNADGQHRASDAVALFQARQANTLLVGSRFVAGGSTPYSLIRQWMSQLASRLVGLISGVPLRDCFSSFFLLERTLLQDLDLAETVVGKGEGMLNLAATLGRRGVNLQEWPIAGRERLAGQSKTDLMGFLAAYLQAALNLRRRGRPSLVLTVLVRLLPLAVLALLLIHEPGSLKHFLAHPDTVLACGAVLAICTLLRAVRWQQIARVAGLRQPLVAALVDVAHGRLMNELLPVRVGEVVRVSRIRSRDGTTLAPVLICLLWEKITGFGIGLLGFGILYGFARSEPDPTRAAVLVGVAAAATVLGSTLLWGSLLTVLQGGRHWLRHHRSGRWIPKLLQELAAIDVRCSGIDWTLALPLKPLLAGSMGVARSLVTIPIRSVLATSLVGYAIWSCTALSLALLALALGAPVTLLEAGAAAFAAGVFSQVRVLPQAMGQPELAIVLVLTSLGHPLDASLLLATADILLQRVMTIVLGVMMVGRNTAPDSGRRGRQQR